jgi:internalin A
MTIDGVEDPIMRDQQAQTPVKAFISYSHKDLDGLEALISHLAPAQRLGNLRPWHDKAIDAGAEWEKVIFDELRQSHIVLCLISADFIKPDFCNRELKHALTQHQEGNQKVIPVQWRSCNWDDLPISKLQGLINDPIKSLPEDERDAAWTQAAKKLDPQIEDVRKNILDQKRNDGFIR